MTEDEKIEQNRLDIRGYMKYILEKGAIQEKRELMQSFTSKPIIEQMPPMNGLTISIKRNFVLGAENTQVVVISN